MVVISSSSCVLLCCAQVKIVPSVALFLNITFWGLTYSTAQQSPLRIKLVGAIPGAKTQHWVLYFGIGLVSLWSHSSVSVRYRHLGFQGRGDCHQPRVPSAVLPVSRSGIHFGEVKWEPRIKKTGVFRSRNQWKGEALHTVQGVCPMPKYKLCLWGGQRRVPPPQHQIPLTMVASGSLSMEPQTHRVESLILYCLRYICSTLTPANEQISFEHFSFCLHYTKNCAVMTSVDLPTCTTMDLLYPGLDLHTASALPFLTDWTYLFPNYVVPCLLLLHPGCLYLHNMDFIKVMSGTCKEQRGSS